MLSPESVQISGDNISGYKAGLKTTNLTDDREYQFPNESGTLALEENFNSGRYTPTITVTINGPSAINFTSRKFTYIKVGAIVSVAGTISYNASTGGYIEVELSLPIPTDVIGSYDIHGSASGYGVGHGDISSHPSTNRVVLYFQTNGSTGPNIGVNFQYEIIEL